MENFNEINNKTHSEINRSSREEDLTEIATSESRRQWLDVLKLLLADIQIFPTVHAAPPPPPPEKPPPMPPKDLPIYKSPHSTYNEYAKAKEFECAKKSDYIKKTLQPIVKTTRVGFQQSMKRKKESFKNGIAGAGEILDKQSDLAVKYFRKEENLELRKAMVGLGGVAGYLFSLKTGVTLKIINTTLGATAMGALCFPVETDDILRKTALFGKNTLNGVYFTIYGVRLFREERNCPNLEPDPDKK